MANYENSINIFSFTQYFKLGHTKLSIHIATFILFNAAPAKPFPVVEVSVSVVSIVVVAAALVAIIVTTVFCFSKCRRKNLIEDSVVRFTYVNQFLDFIISSADFHYGSIFGL